MSKIMVIDDEPQIRLILRQALELVGHKVLEATHGQEAMEIYQKEPVDLVITDIVMPGKEGLDCIIELRRMNPAVRVIAISGGSRSVKIQQGGVVWRLELLEAARRLGARRTFWKPFDLDEFLAAVQEELGDRRVA